MPAELVPSLIVGALMVLGLVGMAFGWRSRVRRQASLDALADIPADLGAARYATESAYVATTLAEKPLDRVAVAGLGIRGRASVAVHDAGVVVDRIGARSVHIPAGDIDSVGLGTFAVDRVVERDGLVVITWRLGGTPVDTYLRPPEPETKRELVAAVRSILPGSITSKAGPSEGTDSADS